MMASAGQRRDDLRDWAVQRLGSAAEGGYRDTCRRVGVVMAEVLDADVAVKFIAVRSPDLTGGLARRADGRYIVYCAKSGSWYHRLGILLHELAHVLLGHRPVELTTSESLSRFLPHLPDQMITLIAGRSHLADADEREAEELADYILARLEATRNEQTDLASLPDHVRRIAEALGDVPRREDR